jgi:hypothetical protein
MLKPLTSTIHSIQLLSFDTYNNIVNQLKNTILPDATFISKIKDDLIIGWFNNDEDTVFKKIIINKNNLKIQVGIMLFMTIHNY